MHSRTFDVHEGAELNFGGVEILSVDRSSPEYKVQKRTVVDLADFALCPGIAYQRAGLN